MERIGLLYPILCTYNGNSSTIEDGKMEGMQWKSEGSWVNNSASRKKYGSNLYMERAVLSTGYSTGTMAAGIRCHNQKWIPVYVSSCKCSSICTMAPLTVSLHKVRYGTGGSHTSYNQRLCQGIRL